MPTVSRSRAPIPIVIGPTVMKNRGPHLPLSAPARELKRIIRIVMGRLDLEGFHRAALVTATLMIAGGVTSFLGIRNPDRADA